MITLRNVTKVYRENGKNKYIIKNVNLELPSNTNIAILGVKSSGRTTLLKLLSGIDHPSSGSIDSDDTFSWIVGSVQGFKMGISIRQNIKFVGRIYGKNPEEIQNLIKEIATFADVGKYMDEPMKDAPQPLKFKIAFKLSLSFDFDYFVVDDGMAVVGAKKAFKARSRAVFQERLKHSNLLMVTNVIAEVRELCDICLVLKDNKLYRFNDIEDGIMLYRQMIKYQPPLTQSLIEGRIYCNDGKVFKNVDLAAIHYKVRPISILQALNINKGTHVLLGKIFRQENKPKQTFQMWPYIVPLKTVLSSDGIIFSSTLQATRFYKDWGFKGKMEDSHIGEVLKYNKGYSEILKINFYYLSEYK